jgi:hypothetical protein
MRISVDRKDAGYAALCALGQLGRHVVVLLNGKPVRACIMADEELGLVLASKVGPDGQFVRDGGRFAVETKTGQVVIVVPTHEATSTAH